MTDTEKYKIRGKMMNLSVWSNYYYDLTPEDKLIEFQKHGINYTELSDEDGFELLKREGTPRKIGEKFGEYASKLGFNITQGHLWLGCRFCTMPDAMKKLMDWIDLFEAIGIKNAVLHCDNLIERHDLTYQEKLEENYKFLAKLKENIKGYNIKICLENCCSITVNSDELLYLVKKLDSPNFGICLDTGHLNMKKDIGYVESQREFILKTRDYLSALHIADNEGLTDQHMMPFSKGNVDFREVISTLKEIGYTGILNYEIPGESYPRPLDIRGYKLDYIKRCYDWMMENY